MSSTALVKAATSAVSNKIIQQAATRAVKTAAPSIAKAAATAVVSKTASRALSKMKVTNTSRNTRAFAPVSYTTNYSNSGRIVRIAQSEIVATVDPNKPHWYSPIAEYSITGFRLSPSNETTFPWLANVAGLFDKFRFRKLSFTFVTTKPTNTQGTVSMAVDFDAYDSTPGDVIQMSNLAKFTTNPVYVNKTVEIPLNHPGNRSWYYNFDGSSGDLKTYNLGTFYICLAGVAEKNSHGYLVVNYDVELCDKNPKLTKTKSVMDDKGIITQAISTLTDPSDSGEYYFNDSSTISKSSDWVSVSGNVFTFTGLKAGQTLVGNVNLFSSSGTLDTTTGSTVASIVNGTLVKSTVEGDNSNANWAFVAKADADGNVVIIPTISWTVTPHRVMTFSTSNYYINP